MNVTLAREILTPHSIQRCVISSGMLGFEHMEPECAFGVGYQQAALRQLVKGGVRRYETSIPVGGQGGRASTLIHLFAEPDFDLSGYRVYLECMARGTLPLDAPTDFERAVCGPNVATSIWFDFTTKVVSRNQVGHNAVFWALSRQTADELEVVLRRLTR